MFHSKNFLLKFFVRQSLPSVNLEHGSWLHKRGTRLPLWIPCEGFIQHGAEDFLPDDAVESYKGVAQLAEFVHAEFFVKESHLHCISLRLF